MKMITFCTVLLVLMIASLTYACVDELWSVVVG
jgi:hypothetical protein